MASKSPNNSSDLVRAFFRGEESDDEQSEDDSDARSVSVPAGSIRRGLGRPIPVRVSPEGVDSDVHVSSAEGVAVADPIPNHCDMIDITIGKCVK